jgi:hypothetical protein
VKRRANGEAGNSYLFALERDPRSSKTELELDIDARFTGNESRYMNDPRGIGAKNVQLAQMRSVMGDVEVWAQTLCAVEPATELLFDYGPGFDVR